MTHDEQIVREAWVAFESWNDRYSEDLEGIEMVERSSIYSYMSDGIGIDLAKRMARMDCERLL